MRLIKLWLCFKRDKDAFVLAFTALSLPIILLIGVLVLQSGQLFIRHSELQFLTRQAAQSGMLSLAQTLRQQAEQNYRVQCAGLEPPEICNSTIWSDFMETSAIEALSQSPTAQQSLQAHLVGFVAVADPQQALINPDLSYDLKIQSGSLDRLSLTLFLVEPQSNWLGNVIRPQDYQIETQALAFLNF